MGRSAILTLRGLYEWDNDLFNGISLPEPLDVDLLIPQILADTDELEVLYPNPVVMREMIGHWSDAYQNAFLHIAKVETAEYNPIENYDRTGQDTEKYEPLTLKMKTDRDTTLSKTGYNSGTMQDTDATEETSEVSGSGSDMRTKTTNLHGNIGVTTNQQMIEAELKLVPRLSAYKQISEMFKSRFCLLVY